VSGVPHSALHWASEKHALLAVREACVQLLRLLQQSLLLRLVEAVHLQVGIAVERLPLHRLLGLTLLLLLLLGVESHQRLATLVVLRRTRTSDE